MLSIFLFCVHVTFSLYLFGVVWFLQLAHYPLLIFLNVDPSQNPIIFHQSRFAFTVMAPMILELVSVVILIFVPYPNFFTALVLLVFTLLTWLSTLTMQMPAVNLLKKEKNEGALKKLVYTNWVRTTLWSLKAIYIFFLLWSLLGENLITIS